MKARGRLNVLAVIASSDPGGAERVLASMVGGLDRERFDVAVVTHGQGPMLDEYRRHATGVWSLDLLNIFNLRSIVALARLMRRLQCQIVHTHLWTADLLGAMAAAMAGVRVRVATVHGSYFRDGEERGIPALRKAVLSRVHRAVYRLYDRVIAVSESVARDLVERPGIRVEPGKIRVIHNGVDSVAASGGDPDAARAGLGIAADAHVVLTVANFAPIKGHRWLVEAMPRILARCPRAVFVFAGDGNLAPGLRRSLQARGLSPHVRFVGSWPDARELIAMSDVVAVPSVDEGLGMVVLEALSLGKPVVATRVGGIPEIIRDEEHGLLVPPRDPGALADAVSGLLANRDLSRRLGECGRTLVAERFPVERMVRATEAQYLELAAEKGLG